MVYSQHPIKGRKVSKQIVVIRIPAHAATLAIEIRTEVSTSGWEQYGLALELLMN